MARFIIGPHDTIGMWAVAGLVAIPLGLAAAVRAPEELRSASLMVTLAGPLGVEMGFGLAWILDRKVRRAWLVPQGAALVTILADAALWLMRGSNPAVGSLLGPGLALYVLLQGLALGTGLGGRILAMQDSWEPTPDQVAGRRRRWRSTLAALGVSAILVGAASAIPPGPPGNASASVATSGERWDVVQTFSDVASLRYDPLVQPVGAGPVVLGPYGIDDPVNQVNLSATRTGSPFDPAIQIAIEFLEGEAWRSGGTVSADGAWTTFDTAGAPQMRLVVEAPSAMHDVDVSVEAQAIHHQAWDCVQEYVEDRPTRADCPDVRARARP